MAAGDELTLSYVAPFSKGLRARQEDIRRNHISVSHVHHHHHISPSSSSSLCYIFCIFNPNWNYRYQNHHCIVPASDVVSAGTGSSRAAASAVQVQQILVGTHIDGVATIADICHNHTTGVGVLFRDGVLCSIENVKF